MKNIIYTRFLGKFSYFFCLFTLILFTYSCGDGFFDRETSPTVEFTNISEAEMGIYAPYQQLVQGSEGSPLWIVTFMHFGMSDIVREIGQNGYNEVYSRSTSSQLAAVDDIFEPSFEIISSCNYLIEYLESNPFPGISESDRTNNLERLIGEAYFLRAQTYLQLVMFFCPAYDPDGSNSSEILPLRTQFASAMDLALDNTPVATSLIYDQIKADLLNAKDLLPKQYASGMDESYQYGRATKHAAMAVLAKLYMLMGEYNSALDELDGVLDDSEVSRALLDDPSDCFMNNSTSPWTDPEIIWYGNFADATLTVDHSYRHLNDYNWFINYTYPQVNAYQEWWIWSLNKDVLQRVGIMNPDYSETDAWKADKRRDLFKRFEGYVYNSNIEKGRSTLSSNSFQGFVDEADPVYLSNRFFLVPDSASYTDPFQNIPIIRSAELYLMRAGIKAIQGSGGQASDLNIVRERSWDESIGGTYVGLTDAQVDWEEVDNEWIKEFAFESDRVMWLQMFQKPIGPGNRDVADIEAPYADFYWPISQDEIDYQ